MRLVLLLATCAAGLPGAAPARTPVILISVDTLRADHLSSYGSTGRATPSIDRLSKGGTLFANVNTLVPLTLPSHVGMLASRYPFQSGVRDNGQVAPASLLLLPEVKLPLVGERRGASDLHAEAGRKGFDGGDRNRLGGDARRSTARHIRQTS